MQGARSGTRVLAPGTTMSLVTCFDDLRLTFAVRSNRDIPFARLFTEFRRSDGRVCGETLMETETFMATGLSPWSQASSRSFR